eukprot:scaffold33992_cov31-Tisochrysis_lutea.AAC.5
MNNVIIQSSSSKRHHQRKLHQHHDNHKVYALLRKYNRDTSRVPHYTRGGMDSRAVAVEEPFVVMPIVVAAIREQAYSQSHTSSRACQRSCNSNRGMRSKADSSEAVMRLSSPHGRDGRSNVSATRTAAETGNSMPYSYAILWRADVAAEGRVALRFCTAQSGTAKRRAEAVCVRRCARVSGLLPGIATESRIGDSRQSKPTDMSRAEASHSMPSRRASTCSRSKTHFGREGSRRKGRPPTVVTAAKGVRSFWSRSATEGKAAQRQDHTGSAIL